MCDVSSASEPDNACYSHRLLTGGSFLTRRSHRSRMDRSLRLIEGSRFDSAADVGAADGWYLENPLEQGVVREGVAIDTDTEALRAAAERSGPLPLLFVTPDDPALGPRRGTFDLVTCLETLEHTPDVSTLLDELVTLARPGGTILISVPVEVGPSVVVKQAGRWLANRGHNYGYKRYSWRELWTAGARWKVDASSARTCSVTRGSTSGKSGSKWTSGSRSPAPRSARCRSSDRSWRAPSTGSAPRGTRAPEGQWLCATALTHFPCTPCGPFGHECAALDTAAPWLSGCGPFSCDSPSSDSLSVDSESVDGLSVVSDSEDFVPVDSGDSVDPVEELSVDSVEALLDDSDEVESVDAGAEESAVKASAAPPLNNPASTTANIARCFFTAVAFNCSSSVHDRTSRWCIHRTWRVRGYRARRWRASAQLADTATVPREGFEPSLCGF